MSCSIQRKRTSESGFDDEEYGSIYALGKQAWCGHQSAYRVHVTQLLLQQHDLLVEIRGRILGYQLGPPLLDYQAHHRSAPEALYAVSHRSPASCRRLGVVSC